MRARVCVRVFVCARGDRYRLSLALFRAREDRRERERERRPRRASRANGRTCCDNFVMSTGLIFLRADRRSSRSRACFSTAMTNASCTLLLATRSCAVKAKETREHGERSADWANVQRRRYGRRRTRRRTRTRRGGAARGRGAGWAACPRRRPGCASSSARTRAPAPARASRSTSRPRATPATAAAPPGRRGPAFCAARPAGRRTTGTT